MQRKAFVYLAITLGSLMVLVGLLSFLTADPRPEVATGGATLMIATGLVGSNGKNNRR